MLYPVPRADRSEPEAVVVFLSIILASVCVTFLLARLLG